MRKSSIIVIIQEIPVVRIITPNHEDISSSLQALLEKGQSVAHHFYPSVAH
jgi:hypothetical protein